MDAILQLVMVLLLVGTSFHLFVIPMEQKLTFKWAAIRSWFHFYGDLALAILRKIPVPYGLEVTPEVKEIKELVEKQSVIWEGVKQSLEEQKKEVKKLGEGSAEVKEKLEKQVTDFGKTVDEARQLVVKTNERVDEFEVLLKKNKYGGYTPEKSIGQIVAESEEMKEFAEKGGASSRPILVKKFQKDVWTDPTSAGDLIVPYRVPGIIQRVPPQQLVIRDLLNPTPIGTPLLEYARETLFAGESESSGFDGNAQITVEKQLKPEANLKFTKEQVTAKCIATWVPASRQILSDVPALTGYINTRLIYSILLEEELQVLYGDGVGDNLEGITLLAAAYNRYQAGDNAIDTLRRAITQVLLAGFPATGFVLNPANWEQIELTKVGAGDDRYVFASPNALLPQRIWGLPVAVSQSMQQGEGLCGAFGLGATLFIREDASVQVFEQHADFAIRNMVAIRAEERVMLPIFRPQAFVYGSIHASS